MSKKTQEEVKLVSLKYFLDYANNDQAEKFIIMLMLQNPKVFAAMMSANSHHDIDKMEAFNKMLDTDFIYVQWVDEKLQFVRFDKEIIKTF